MSVPSPSIPILHSPPLVLRVRRVNPVPRWIAGRAGLGGWNGRLGASRGLLEVLRTGKRPVKVDEKWIGVDGSES